MNAREKILLFALLGVVGLPALIYGGKRWWWDPLTVNRNQATKLQEDVERINAELDRFHDGQARLNKARLRSLPAKPDQASTEYQLQYLKPMLLKSGLTVDEITPSRTIQKMRVVTPIQGVKAVGHQIMSFTVRASGELPALVAALEQMRKTPYEHRIKSLTIDRAEPAGSKKKSSTKLNIQMNIEVLLVAGTKNKPGAPLHPELVQASPQSRLYAQIAKRNIFVGALPPIIVPPEPEKEGYKKSEETPKFIYLTHTSPDEQIAYLRNYLYDGPERMVKAIAGSGYDTFVIRDTGGGYTFFRAKVLKIDLHQIFIQIKDEVFTVKIGKSLADREVYGFSRSRIELEDDGLFDPRFRDEEMGKTKKASKVSTRGR